MKTRCSQVAQTTLGVSFEDWKHRPVYKVQCFTYKAAAELCGLALSAGSGCRCLSDQGANALQGFRKLAAYRDNEANALRTRVAHHIKSMSREAALMV